MPICSECINIYVLVSRISVVKNKELTSTWHTCKTWKSKHSKQYQPHCTSLDGQNDCTVAQYSKILKDLTLKDLFDRVWMTYNHFNVSVNVRSTDSYFSKSKPFSHELWHFMLQGILPCQIFLSGLNQNIYNAQNQHFHSGINPYGHARWKTE